MASASNYILPETYPRRSGTILDNSGGKYEINIAALLSLRCASMDDTEDMWIGINVDEFGAFDDLVLSKRTTEGEHIIYLIQLKHQENPKDIKRNDFTYSHENKNENEKQKQKQFSLSKYYTSYSDLIIPKIKQSTTDEAKVIKLVLVLYTNKGVDLEKCEFLNTTNDPSGFLNTGGNSYSFDHTKLMEYKSDFLEKLLLFCNQVGVTDTDKLIENEIKEMLSSINMTNVDFEKVAKKFVEFIKTWAKGVKINAKEKVCYTLKKDDVINVLIRLLLKPYTLDFFRDKYDTYDCPKKNRWSEIVRDVAVTVVDFDERILEFLKQYVGVEARKYCEESTNSWNDCLSKTAVDLYYQNHSNLNNQVLKIERNDEKLTMYDLYQNLWFNKKLPLLLKIKYTKSYNDVIRILKIANCNLKVIMINKSNSVVTINEPEPNHFLKLSDLSVESRKIVLENSAKLQGRSSVVLKEHVDDSMYEYFSSNDVIDVLLNNFSIGNEYEPLDKYFIPRSLFKIFLNPHVLSNIKDEQFVIQTKNDDDVLNNKFSVFTSNNKDNDNLIFISKENLSQTRGLKSRGKIIHRLIFHGENLLEWKESYGNTRSIRKYQKDYIYSLEETIEDDLSLSSDDSSLSNDDSSLSSDDYSLSNDDSSLSSETVPEYQEDSIDIWSSLEKTIEDDMSCSLGNTMRIIGAPPGMGKSTSLNYIAHEAPTNLWVLKINLLDHDEYYKSKTIKSRANDHLKYFNEAILKKYKCKNIQLARAIFEKFLKTKRVLLLLDGFDEISIGYKDEVTEISKSLHEENFPMWLTTRPHMKTHLENQFGTLSTTLKPFTTDDQELFLNKYFSEVAVTGANTEERQILIQEFITKLLRAARRNLSNEASEFTGIPLQTKLLANVFIDELNISLKTGTIKFTERFDLIFLYENFLERKNKILYEKLGPGADQMAVSFREHLQLLAVTTVFGDILQKRNIGEKLENYYKNIYDLQVLQQEGIIFIEDDKVRKERFNFVHRTYAEYWAARWLSEQYDSECVEVKMMARRFITLRFNYLDSRFVFRMFDCILAKNCPLHILIINNQVDEAKKMIREKPDVLDTTDEGGRTVLHLLALYGRNEDGDKLKDYTCMDEHIASVIREIPNDKITNLKDKILGWSALDYALINKTYSVANKMCEKKEDLIIGIYLIPYIIFTEGLYLYRENYKSLFKKLITYYICLNILTSKDSTVINENIISFVDDNIMPFYNFYLSESKAEITISEYLEAINIKSTTEPVYYNDLRFAVAFGTADNVRHLLSSSDTVEQINEVDCYKNVLLHYAVLKGRYQMVKILLDHGACVNQPDYHGGTAIYLTAQYFSQTMSINVIFSSRSEIDKMNNRRQSPLHMAVLNKNLENVKLLLEHAANINHPDGYGDTPIHVAAECCSDPMIMNLLLSKQPEINKLNYNSQLPLHLALLNKNLENVKLLLEHTADINQPDRNGDTPIHLAAQYCFEPMIMNLLLSKKPEIDKYNHDGRFPLQLAVLNNNLEFIQLLLYHGADVNHRDKYGNTWLHFAALNCDRNTVFVMKKLLEKTNVNINMQNEIGNAPLCDVFRNKESVNLPFSSGVDCNIQINEGNCPLHETAGSSASDDVLNEISSNRNKALNIKNKKYRTPLHLAVCGLEISLENNLQFHYCTKTVEFLINNGADVNIQDIDSNTILHCLCLEFAKADKDHSRYKQVTIYCNTVALLLLNNGADLNLLNKNGETALDLASKLTCTKIKSLIQQKISNPTKQLINDEDLKLLNENNLTTDFDYSDFYYLSEKLLH